MSPFGRPLRSIRSLASMALGWLAYRCGRHASARRHYERVLLLTGANFRAYVQLGRIAFDLGDYAGWRREFEHARRTDPVRFAQLKHPVELFEPRLAGTRYQPPAGMASGIVATGSDDFEATDARATWRALHPFDRESGPDPDGDGLGLEGLRRGSELASSDFDPLLPDPRHRHGRTSSPRPTGDEASQASAARRPDHDGGNVPGESRDASMRDSSMPDASLTHDDFASAAERSRFRLRRPIDRQEVRRCDVDELARRLIG